MFENFRRKARRAVMTVLSLYWLIIFLGTHTTLSPGPGFHLNDKLLHFLAYTGLGFLLSWSVLRMRPTREGVFVVLLILAGYGFADEMSQMLVPTRSADVMDWLADLCGGCVGLSLYFASLRLCASRTEADCPSSPVVRRDAA